MLLSKILAAGKAPPRPHYAQILWSWFGAASGIAIVALVADVSGHPLLMAPLGASAVLAFAVPESPLAQPRNIVGGHLSTTIVGLLVLGLFGASWWAAGLAVATAIAVMQITRTVHPPAGANPLVVLAVGAGWEYVILPVLVSTVMLTVWAYVFHNFVARRQYPTYWF
ncbi:MAG: HPP family protein [Kordiimonadaceae bacterium]|nr:HPP family protein [Kordiimonadaceae bacterium]